MLTTITWQLLLARVCPINQPGPYLIPTGQRHHLSARNCTPYYHLLPPLSEQTYVCTSAGCPTMRDVKSWYCRRNGVEPDNTRTASPEPVGFLGDGFLTRKGKSNCPFRFRNEAFELDCVSHPRQRAAEPEGRCTPRWRHFNSRFLTHPLPSPSISSSFLSPFFSFSLLYPPPSLSLYSSTNVYPPSVDSESACFSRISSTRRVLTRTRNL